MQNIFTIATRINHQNYSIAVACLAGGFAALPLSKTIGHILILNEIRPITTKEHGRSPVVGLSNSWMTEELFLETYEICEYDLDDMDDNFVTVELK